VKINQGGPFDFTGKQPTLLQLHSGSESSILYPGSERPEVQTLVHAAVPHRANATSAQRAFAVVPPQNMFIRAAGNFINTAQPFKAADRHSGMRCYIGNPDPENRT
jgi:hypothetical protein